MFSLWAGCEGSDCGIRCEYPHHSRVLQPYLALTEQARSRYTLLQQPFAVQPIFKFIKKDFALRVRDF